MKKIETSRNATAGSHVLLYLILALILSMAGCGGSSSTGAKISGGSGGGGGGNALSCTFTPSAGGVTTSGPGLNNPIQEQYFGMHLNSTVAPWPFFSFGSQRLWDSGVAWSNVNTAPGVYDWTRLDTWLAEAQQHGVDVLYDLARTPTWASSVPSDSTCIDSAVNGAGQCHPPGDVGTDGGGSDATWIQWVTDLARHSQQNKAAGDPGISYYEIWNEWNQPIFWLGTTKQLIRMEQDARCVVEGPPSGMTCHPMSVFPSGTGVDSSAKIVTPSPVGSHTFLSAVGDNLFTYFQTQVNGFSGGAFSDAIGFHGYVGTRSANGSTTVQCPVPEDVNTVLADLDNTLAAFPAVTAGKPLFNTEGGWSKADDEGFDDEDRQAAFLPRYLLLQESGNISRVYWYAWDSKRQASLYNDTTGSSTLAATAYDQVNQWSVGASMNQPCSANGSVWTCGFTRPGGYVALAVWDAGQDCTSTSCVAATAFTIPPTGFIEYRDVAGNVTPLNAASSVQVGAKPILLETSPLP